MAIKERSPGAGQGDDGIAAQQRREFGASLRAARLNAALTQADLAALTGVDQKYISRIENGTVNLTLETMAVLARALGLDVKVFLAQPTEPKQK
jgi:transcriptional regulator with XRE-family HTH domain